MRDQRENEGDRREQRRSGFARTRVRRRNEIHKLLEEYRILLRL
jgi:hypothetical protein